MENLKKVKTTMTFGDKLKTAHVLRVERPRKPLPGQLSLTLADGTPLAENPPPIQKRAHHD